MAVGYRFVRTVLLLIGYRPIAEWMCSSLEADEHILAVANDTSTASMIALLLRVNVVVA